MKDAFYLKTCSIFSCCIERFFDDAHSFQLHAGIGNTKEPVMLLNLARNKHNNLGLSYE